MSKLAEANVLPPNVNGKNRGYLEIEIVGVNWTAAAAAAAINQKGVITKLELKKLSNSSNHYNNNRLNSNKFSSGFSLKFIWWGENPHKSLQTQINLIDKRIPEVNPILRYHIQTSYQLFYNYLLHCEPIHIKITSKISNLHIGTVLAQIPDKIIQNCLNNYTDNTNPTASTATATNSSSSGSGISISIQKYQIISPKKLTLGYLILKFKMLFFEQQSPVTNTVHVPPNIKIHKHKLPLKSNVIYDNEYHLKNEKSIEEISNNHNLSLNSSNRSSQIDSKQLSSNNNTAVTPNCTSTIIMDYLTGREMSSEDEKNALLEIHRTSPLNSIITVSDDLSSLKVNSQLPSIQSNKSNHKLQQIDALRLKVNSLKLLLAGCRMLHVDSLIRTTFTIECRISPNLMDNVRTKMDFDVMRFYSDTYNDSEQIIDFNKDAVRSVKIIFNDLDSSIIEHAELLFTIWWRNFGSKESRCLGTCRFRFTNLLQSKDMNQKAKLNVISCADGQHVADLTCKIALGTKGVHFGSELIKFIEPTKKCLSSMNRNNNSQEFTCDQKMDSFHTFNSKSLSSRSSDYRHAAKENVYCEFVECNINDNVRKTPNSNNGNDSSTKSKSSGSSETRRETNSQQSARSLCDFAKLDNYNEKESSNVKTIQENNIENFRLLQGLLYVGGMRNMTAVTNGGYFLVCRAFWKEDATSTDFAENDQFNFLEIFPIINNESFLERTRNNYLALEIWQKSIGSHEQYVGIVRVPLHQFFIAFRDKTLTNHLCKANHPVISMDGWASIISPLSGITCGQLQTLLAIGTEEQLEDLKTARGICSDSVFINSNITVQSPKIPVPTLPTPPQHRNCDAQNQTNFDDSTTESKTHINNIQQKEKFNDFLGSFLENLAHKIPSIPKNNTVVEKPVLQESLDKTESSNKCSEQKSQPLRRTSDLLDVLERALTPCSSSGNSTSRLNPSTPITNSTVISSKFCKILLEIECALHLPRNPLKMGNKKGTAKKNSNNGKEKQIIRFPPNEEPSAYVTFQAEEGYGQMIKSHEGMVYATNVIEKCSNPSWGKRFEIVVPIDMLLNDEKRFILKVWKKAATNVVQSRFLPTPLDDSIIGFAAIDLTVLMARMPCISGWFNIVDFNGRINGQIKINVQPLEDVMKFKQLYYPTKSLNNCFSSISGISTARSTISSTIKQSDFSNDMMNLEGDENSSSNDDISDLNNLTLSRAIKRKFSELEEITQRLRARLLDVTGTGVAADDAAENDLNEIDDAKLDEFERDLNTVCIDDENEDEKFRLQIGELSENSFKWIEKETTGNNLEQKQNNEPKTINIQQPDPDEENLSSTCSSQERIQMISEFLQRTDISEFHNNRNYDFERNPPEGGTENHSGSKND